MAQGTVHVDENGAVPKIDISIINEKSLAVSIFRLDPNTFEEEPVVELGSAETTTVTLRVTGDREPIPCRICQDAVAHSIWVRAT